MEIMNMSNMTEQTKRTWAEIHMDRLAANYREIRSRIPEHTKFLALVKANAYGHGAVPVAKKFEELGADYFAVACLDEAEELRAGGITRPILILGATDPRFTDRLIAGNITQTVYDLDMAKEFSANAQAVGGTLKIHLKADTGMSRLGFLCDEEHIPASAEKMAEVAHLPGLFAEGLFMHFAVADSYDPKCEAYSKMQIARYNALYAKLNEKGITVPIRHCTASAAILNYPEAHFDMVRPGIIQYGIAPDPCMLEAMPLQPVMEFKSRIVSLKEMPAGTTISYGRTYTLTRDSKIAVIPAGYADGLFRLLSNGQDMIIRGKRVPQIGRVCMDMCMIDVTDLPEAEIGDEVTIFGDGLSVQEKADIVGTIPYELICAVAPRVPRVYLG